MQLTAVWFLLDSPVFADTFMIVRHNKFQLVMCNKTSAAAATSKAFQRIATTSPSSLDAVVSIKHPFFS